MNHEAPIKEVLRKLLGERFNDHVSETRFVIRNTGTQIEPDAVIDKDAVVEIESRTPKQIRGALMDLLTHPFKKKLLIIRPANANADRIGAHCNEIVAQYLRADEKFYVVVLRMDQQEDEELIREGLTVLKLI